MFQGCRRFFTDPFTGVLGGAVLGLLAAASFSALAAAAGGGGAAWPGGKSRWHGFERYDFALQDTPCRVVAPRDPAPGRPWAWRARFPDFHFESDRLLLERGFHVAYMNTDGMLGSPRAMRLWEGFYRFLTKEHGFAPKPAMEGVSRGGLFVYRWASRHPDRVACIYADTPVCDFKSWPLGQGKGRGDPASWRRLLEEYDFKQEQALAYKGNPVDVLGPIAAARIPILHIVSLDDRIVPPEENTFVLAKRYRALGGKIDVMTVAKGTKKSGGHHFTHPDPLRPADFMELYASALPKEEGYAVLRGPLENCRIRFEREGRGRVVFLGGSITFNPGWRDGVRDFLRRRFPKTAFDFVNAGIPSMGSVPGAFRLTRDVFGKGPVDLLFEEAAVNDRCNGRAAVEISRGMEGIVRHARKIDPFLDTVILYFADPAKTADYRAGKTPPEIRLHEAVAARYGATSIDLAREVRERIDAGQFSWKKDFRGLHPSPFGQRLYAAAIRRMFAASWAEPLPEGAARKAHDLPPPIDPFSYDAGRLVPVTAAGPLSGFAVVDPCDPRKAAGGGVRAGFFDVPMLVGVEPGDAFVLSFSGRAVGLFAAAGPDAGEIRYRIDGGPWEEKDLFTKWSAGLHLPWAVILGGELAAGEHRLEVRVAEEKNPKSMGHACRIVHFLVNGNG